MTSWKTPTTDQVTRAIALMSHAEYQKYFFERLENPLWIAALKEKGLFNIPMPNQIHPDGSFSCPHWPVSKYLVRMAKYVEVQEKIAEILLQSGVPENYNVHQDYLKIAVIMPLEFQIKWSQIEKKWLDEQKYIWMGSIAECMVDLGISLLRKGHYEEARLMFFSLFGLIPDETSQEEREVNRLKKPPNPRPRIDSWDYENLIKKVASELDAASDVNMLGLFLELLNEVIRLSHDHCKERDTMYDFSSIWRPAIEDHPQNKNLHMVEDSLVTALRNCALQSIQRDISQLRVIIQLLESFRPERAVFYRVVLYLLTVFPKGAQDLIEERLLYKKLFEAIDVRHEYMRLLQQEYRNLPPKGKRKILWWIWRECKRKEAAEILSSSFRRPLTKEDIETFIIGHRLNWLTVIKDDLPPQWKAVYDKYVSSHQPSPHPDFPSYMEDMVCGDRSPFTQEELAKLPIPEIVDRLKTWTPPANRFMGPSKRGLGFALQAVIAKSPERFCREASAFKLSEPTYVRSYIDAFCDVAGVGKKFEWADVLGLCKWALDQSTGACQRDHLGDSEDPDWTWTRQSITRLLREGFQRKEVLFPYEMRDRIWQVLYPLTQDPSPTPEEEERYGDSLRSPYDYALNCIRGSAMIEVMRYIEWVRIYIKSQEGGEALLRQGFDAIAEAKEVLEQRLNPSTDSSRAVRSVYGLYFPWLCLWDKKWVVSHLGDIFPRESGLSELRLAAWNTYLTWCPPYDEPLELLYDEYLLAAHSIGESSEEEKKSDSPLEKLGEHLTTYYARDLIDLGPESPLTIFLQKASDEARARTMSHIGKALEDSPQVSPVVKARLKDYWASRLNAAKKAPEVFGFLKEIAAFGWWVTSNKFDEEWILSNLVEALTIAKGIERPPDVQKYLAEASAKYPAPAIKCLNLMLKGGRKTWEGPYIASHEDLNRTIITNANNSDNADARTLAQELIHLLGAMGFLGYRDLLKE
jgi:hypothetical protein